MKKVYVIGAGPAGLTAAYELLRQSREYEVIVLEESDAMGGISRTPLLHQGAGSKRLVGTDAARTGRALL